VSAYRQTSDSTGSAAAGSPDGTPSAFSQIFARSREAGRPGVDAHPDSQKPDAQKKADSSTIHSAEPANHAKAGASATSALPADPKKAHPAVDSKALAEGDRTDAAPQELALWLGAAQADGNANASAPPAAGATSDNGNAGGKADSNRVVARTAASAAPAQASPEGGALAFAMRISPGADKNNATSTAVNSNGGGEETAPAGNPSSGSRAEQLKTALALTPGGAAATSAGTANSGMQSGVFGLAAPVAPAVHSSGPSLTPPAPAANLAALNEPASEGGAAGSVPVRGVHVQIAGADDQRVDLRLLESGGSLSVSVRSSDGGLTHNLQDSLPELNSRLAEQRYQTEIYTPGTAFHSSSNGNGDAGQSRPGSSANKNGGSFGNGSPGSQTGHSGQQQNGRQSKPPEWLPERASSGRESEIRRDYSWLQ
jgi:hypothetical protein